MSRDVGSTLFQAAENGQSGPWRGAEASILARPKTTGRARGWCTAEPAVRSARPCCRLHIVTTSCSSSVDVELPSRRPDRTQRISVSKRPHPEVRTGSSLKGGQVRLSKTSAFHGWRLRTVSYPWNPLSVRRPHPRKALSPSARLPPSRFEPLPAAHDSCPDRELGKAGGRVLGCVAHQPTSRSQLRNGGQF